MSVDIWNLEKKLHDIKLNQCKHSYSKKASTEFQRSILPPDQECRAADACVDWMEWVFGLERMTTEQRERVALFRTRYVKMISARSEKPYLDSLGIPRIPFDCEKKYRHREGGQPPLDTLREPRGSAAAAKGTRTEERSHSELASAPADPAKKRQNTPRTAADAFLLPSNFFVGSEAFSPKENIIESLYCARTRCGWSSVDQTGCPDARRYCRRIERGEQEDRTADRQGLS